MKRVISAALALVLVLSLMGCSLFSDASIVKFDETYTHKDPEGLTYDKRIVLQGEGFEETLETGVNSLAYPDTMIYDDNGSMVGMYDYDPLTGLAKGWMDLSTGAYTAYESGKEVSLGMPDSSMMIDIPGTVTLGCVVYGNEDAAVMAYIYAFLSDGAAKDMVAAGMEAYYGLSMTAQSDTVLVAERDADAIAAEFAREESYGPVPAKDASAYADILKMNYGVREYSGANPYKPFEDYEEPTEFEWDEKVVLTGAGEYAVAEEFVSDLACMTDVVYGKDGVVVAHYTYLEMKSKEAADKMMDSQDIYLNNPVRVNDTVLQGSLTGQGMKDLLVAYKGYTVLKDDSVTEYVRMIEESFFSTVCE